MVKRRNKCNSSNPVDDNNQVNNSFNIAQRNILNLISSGVGSQLPPDHDEHVMTEFNRMFKKRGRPKGSVKKGTKLVKEDADKNNTLKNSITKKRRGRPRKNTSQLPLTTNLSSETSVESTLKENPSYTCHIDDHHSAIALKEVQNSNTISESG
uniref:Uncharacterized protein n=1 Tax=Parastrongyloides trichosuri TaxID=131310 RepID=A0A0N4ZSW7_PARTI